VPLVLKMELNIDFDHFNEEDDEESLASAEEDDDDIEYPIEKIIAEFTGKNGHVWFLVKWHNCPLVRSSWECVTVFDDIPWVLDEWKLEKQRQREGKSKPLDIAAFNKAVLEVEVAERLRRTLRRLKKQATGVLTTLNTT